MTTEAQRIAIAQLCGWTNCQPWKPDAGAVGHPPGWAGPHNHDFRTLPRYTTDLNAMHAAVDHANATQPDAWNDEHFLQTLCGYTSGFPHRATAAQWAEAFLRIHNKWEVLTANEEATPPEKPATTYAMTIPTCWKRDVPEGHAYLSTDGGFQPATTIFLVLPKGEFGERVRLCGVEAGDDEVLRLARDWIATNEPATPLHAFYIRKL